MYFQLLRLQFLKGLRSVSIGRNIVGGIFLALIVVVFLANLLVLSFALESIIENSLGYPDAHNFLNGLLIYFFVFEILSRFFVQKLPVIEMESFLHHPIRRSTIIHYLLGRSLFTPMSLVVIVCFGPFAFTEIREAAGMPGAAGWLLTLLLISFTLHWFMLWYKQRYGDTLAGIASLVLLPSVVIGGHYLGYFNAGAWASPFFTASMSSYLPALLALAAAALSYLLTFGYYRRHAYIEELGDRRNITFINRSIDFFSRFGLAGEIADLEWKLILRHKKSRIYLLITALFLLYGLIFYGDPAYQSETGFSYFYIFLGIFITGIFMMQYGQLFLSWNSASFDFFLSRKEGLRALVKGKYLLFFVMSVLCFLLSVPYVYYGWDVLLVHFACFLFNMGVSIHIIVWLSLWKPKPMDLSKGAMFNYEGIGAAQFLMMIPMLGIPYLVFLPFALWIGDYVGLAVLAGTGLAGMLFWDPLSDICVRKLARNRYQISSSFRQEI